MMKAILTCLLILNLWIMAATGLNYAQSTASAAFIVSAVSRYKTADNAAEVEALQARISRMLNGIRRPYVSLAYGGGAAAVLSAIGLILTRRRRVSIGIGTPLA
jgi:hypothetical protein